MYRGAMGFVVVLIVLALLDRAGAFGIKSRDWQMFNRQSFPVVRVINGDELVIRDESGAEHEVSLIGVDAPDLDAYWAAQATEYLTNRTRDRKVILRFDTTRSRDDLGRLHAYVYVNDGDQLNLDILRDGQAYADRRQVHSLSGQFSAAESEARKKPRGLWKDLKFADMPQWRQEWLNSLKR